MNENTLEQAIIQNLTETGGYLYTHGSAVHKKNAEVLLREDLDSYLTKAYPALTDTEKETIIRQFENVSSGDLYAANKKNSPVDSRRIPLQT